MLNSELKTNKTTLLFKSKLINSRLELNKLGLS